MLEGSLEIAWGSLGGPQASLEVSRRALGEPLGTLGGSLGCPWGLPVGSVEVPGWSMGFKGSPGGLGGSLWASPGGPMSRFDVETRAVSTIPGTPKLLNVTNRPAMDQQQVSHAGVWAPLSSELRLRAMQMSERRLRAWDLTRPGLMAPRILWPRSSISFLFIHSSFEHFLFHMRWTVYFQAVKD